MKYVLVYYGGGMPESPAAQASRASDAMEYIRAGSDLVPPSARVGDAAIRRLVSCGNETLVCFASRSAAARLARIPIW